MITTCALTWFYAGSYYAVDRIVTSNVSVPSSSATQWPASTWLVAAVVMTVFVSVFLLHHLLRLNRLSLRLNLLYVHAANGFYVDSILRRASAHRSLVNQRFSLSQILTTRIIFHQDRLMLQPTLQSHSDSQPYNEISSRRVGASKASGSFDSTEQLRTNQFSAVPHILEVLQRVQDGVAPVWPLKDYVAINPYSSLSDRRLLSARQFLRGFSDCELLMPLAYYAEEYQRGHLQIGDIKEAVDESRHDSFEPLLETDVATIERTLLSMLDTDNESDSHNSSRNEQRRIRTVSEYVDRFTNTEWTEIIRDEIAKCCERITMNAKRHGPAHGSICRCIRPGGPRPCMIETPNCSG